MRYPKLRELKEAVKALIKGPYTTRFPFEPHKPFPRFRGKPIPDEKECIGCGACVEVCPANAIEIIDLPPTRSLVWHYDLCIFCAQCERLCTTEKGVKLSNEEFDMAVLDRKTLFTEIKKELVLCENCGEIIAPKDQLMWVAKKLSSLTYGNQLIFSTLHKFLELNQPAVSTPGNSSEKQTIRIRRSDLFKVVCPKCRHQFHLFDEYGSR